MRKPVAISDQSLAGNLKADNSGIRSMQHQLNQSKLQFSEVLHWPDRVVVSLINLALC